MKSVLKTFSEDRRGVSEIIGFALSFSIIFFISTVVVLSAGPIIDSAESQNAEFPVNNNFVYLNEKVYDVQDGAGNKIFELDMPAGQLNQLNATEISFDPESGSENITVETHPLEFVTENGDQIVYDAGFITNQYADENSNATHVHYRSKDSFSSSQTLLRVPSISSGESNSVSASTRSRLVQFQIDQTANTEPPISRAFTEGETVEVTVETSVPDSWMVYMEESSVFSDVEVDEDDENKITARIEVDDDDSVTIVTRPMSIRF